MKINENPLSCAQSITRSYRRFERRISSYSKKTKLYILKLTYLLSRLVYVDKEHQCGLGRKGIRECYEEERKSHLEASAPGRTGNEGGSEEVEIILRPRRCVNISGTRRPI